MNTDEPVIEKQTKDPEEIKAFYDVLKSMAERILLPDNIITNVDFNKDGNVDGYTFEIANPFYTAEAISSVRDMSVIIDNETVDINKISLIVRGQKIRLTDAYTFHELFWGFGEVISVLVENKNGIPKGEHKLECTLRMRTTISYGFPGGLLFPVKRKMIVN